MAELDGAGAGPLVPPADAREKGWSVPRPERIPPDTYSPAALGLGIALLAWGIVTTLAISLVGLAIFAVSLGHWIGEVRRDATR